MLNKLSDSKTFYFINKKYNFTSNLSKVNLNEYRIPEEYYFRIHHIRPRFKGDIENVLIYVASEITKVGERPTEEFVGAVKQGTLPRSAVKHRDGSSFHRMNT